MSLRGASADPEPKAYTTEDLPLSELEEGDPLLQHNTANAAFQWRLLLATVAEAFKQLPKGVRSWRSWMGGILVVLLLIILLLLCFQHSPDELRRGLAVLTRLPSRHVAREHQNEESDPSAGKEQGWNLHEKNHRESGAGGACWALQERHLYYPKSQHVPSPALLDALREYELRHQRCTVGVDGWAQHFRQPQAGYEDCQYIVWKERPEGLGNIVNSILGAFEYALLTGRVLLLEVGKRGIDQLICNPMPFSSWWLPVGVPLDALKAAPRQGAFLHPDDPKLGGKNMVTVHLPGRFSDEEEDDKKFMCDEGQQHIANVTWSIFDSNQYIGPGLWLIPMFQEKLHVLFPDRRMYTHLIRYVYLPVNEVWERVTRDYDIYFRHAVVRVGVQIRTFAPYNPAVTWRVMDCLTHEGALPAPIDEKQNLVMLSQARAPAPSQGRQKKPLRQLLFMASMYREYFEDFRRIYGDRPTQDGSTVAIFAEAAEGGEVHRVYADRHAMTDQLLLSMSDVLLISVASTFGYVVNGLAGHNKTFFMNISENKGYGKGTQFANNNRTVCERVWGQESCHGFKQDLPCNNWEKIYGTKDPRNWQSYILACQDHFGISLIPTYD